MDIQRDLSFLVLSSQNTNKSNNSSYINNLIQQNSQHIIQPASYVPGITLFAYKDSSLYDEIMLCSELPLLKQGKTVTKF